MTVREEHAAYVQKMHAALDAAIKDYGFDAHFHEDCLNQFGRLARSRALTPGEQETETAIRALVCLESLAG